MMEPRYTYTAEAPCFKVTNDKPFVLQGCSCGWPAKCCSKLHGRTEQSRNVTYTASVLYVSPSGDSPR